MSSRFENVSFGSIFGSSCFWISFGIFGVGILFWIDSISDSVEDMRWFNLFLRSCFWRARTLRLWRRLRDWRRSAWDIRTLDLFCR